MNFVVLSSSRGTTFQAILDRIADGSLTMTCLGLVANREDRGCVEKARAAKLPHRVVEKKKDETRDQYDQRVHDAIMDLANGEHIDVIAAVGWFSLLSAWFVEEWRGRILNVHPALLPKHPGMHAHEEVLAAGEKESGMTIHLIDEGLDTGQIIVQKSCPVRPDDTPETLKKRVQELEKEWYPKVLQMIETGTVVLPAS
jgi:formyltetrahydrofolate-dependent phosphoribosylglycinamide formyltransferase